MSLFRKAGEKFEETKRAFVEGDGRDGGDGDDDGDAVDEGGDDADYVCRSCEEAVAEDYDYCPHCGSESVEPAA